LVALLRSLFTSVINTSISPPVTTPPTWTAAVVLKHSQVILNLERRYGSHSPLVRLPSDRFVAKAQLTSLTGIGSAWPSSSLQPSSSSSPPSHRLSLETSLFSRSCSQISPIFVILPSHSVPLGIAFSMFLPSSEHGLFFTEIPF